MSTAAPVLHISRKAPLSCPEEDGRRVLATGSIRGHSPLISMTARFGDLQASMLLEAARRERRARECT